MLAPPAPAALVFPGDSNNEWDSWPETSSISLKVRFKDSDHSYCCFAWTKIWAASWTLEISQSCQTYISHLLWVVLYSHSVSIMQHFWTHQPQNNITKGLYAPVPLSLLIPVIIHLFTHVLFVLMHVDCKACWLFPILEPLCVSKG